MNFILRALQLVTIFCCLLISSNLNAQIQHTNKVELRERISEKPSGRVINSTSEALVWLSNVLNSKNSNWTIQREVEDEQGFKHIHLQQTYKSYPVLGGEIKLHFNKEGLYLANGFYNPIDKIENEITLNKDRAFNYALEANPSMQFIWECQDDYTIIEPEIYILPSLEDSRKYYYVYKIDVYSIQPLFRYSSFIQADSGKELEKYSRIHTSDSNGSGNTMYRGTQSFTTDSVSEGVFNLKNTIGGGIHTLDMNETTSIESEFIDTDNIWTSTLNDDHAALDAHWGVIETYNYFSNTHSHDSYDNNDAAIKSRVHYDVDYVNAFWDGTQLTYGDGYSPTTTPLTTLSIVGHEFSHGVIEHTAGLVYSYESGALNESFADIFGTCVDFHVDSSQADYLMGNEIYSNGSFFRSMANPNLASDPDTYNGTYWATGSDDFGGVHTNSGVQNYWFYLLAEGGTGTNDNSNTFSVTGIGRLKAAKIAYRSLNLYLSSYSDYDDARTYAIQAATDLYGSCSAEVIATTNAWYAVGVGSVFSSSVAALFTADNTYSCSLPFTVNFTNNSTNGTTYAWDFGDDSTSTLAAPSHTFTAAGTYDIQLITTGTATCNSGNDTLLLTAYIDVDSAGAPIAATCNSNFSYTNTSYFIDNFSFGTITNNTGTTGTSVEDYTCSYNTNITAGVLTNIFTSSNYYSNDIKIWIDYNNSGDFDDTEVLASSLSYSINENVILSHDSLVYNTPLRLRVISTNSTLGSACNSDYYYGQQEDYTVTILQNTNPPVANFTADETNISTGTDVQFNDLSQNIPTSWSWSFPGGIPSVSTAQDPTVTYGSTGTYDAQLIVTNSYGSDTVNYSNYIAVSNTFTMCTDLSSESLNGILYDSGGPTGSYSNGENCTFLIGQDCIDTIHLSLNSLNLENGYDYIRIYKGDQVNSSNQLFYGSNSSSQQFVIDDSHALITFHSDGSVTNPGFDISWTAISLDTLTPTTDFTYVDTIPVNTAWEFISNTSTDVTEWIWKLNGNTVSSDSIAILSFTTSGINTVSLIGSNCSMSDTMTYSVFVQNYPILSIEPDTIFATIDCGSSTLMDSLLFIENTGTGDAIISLESEGGNDSIYVLAMTYGVYYYSEFSNTLNAINEFSNNVVVTELYSSNLAAFETALVGKDIVLFPKVESSSSLSYATHATALTNFVNDGGQVIFQGRDSYYGNSMISTGLISGSSYAYLSGNYDVELPNDPLLDSVTTPVNTGYYSYGYNLSDTSFVDVLTSSNSSILSYRTMGEGMIYYLGFDFQYYSVVQSRVMHNIIQQSAASDILVPDSLEYTVSALDSIYIPYNVDVSNLFAGTYNYSLTVTTNDSIGVYEIPVVLTVEGISTLEVDTACIVFDPMFANAIDSTTLTLENTSCTEVYLSSIYTSDNNIFTLSSDSMVISPFSSEELSIYFSSDTINVYNEVLTLITQNDSISICLSGETTPPPNIEVTPNTIPTQYVSCYDEITLDFMVYNTGLTNLEFETGYEGSAPVNIISLSYGAYSSSILNMETALNSTGLNYDLKNYYGTNEDSVDHYLSLGSILVLPAINNSYNIFDYSTLVDKMEDFVNDGGHIIVLGTSRYEIYNSDLFTGSYTAYINNNYTTLNALSGSALLENTTAPYYSQSATYYHNFTNTGREDVLTYNNYQVVSNWDYGDGLVTYIGYTYYNYNSNTAAILENAIIENYSSDIITFTTDTGIVVAGDSLAIQLTIDVSSFPTGTNNETVIFYSNDPDSSVYTIDFTLIKDITPCPEFTSIRQYVNVGDTVSFIDLSTNTPTSWLWDFENGSPDSSIVQNPTEYYYTKGLHDVSLEVSNSQGTYSVTKEEYIRVDHLYNMCDTNQAITTTGILFDSGGELDNHGIYENCSFLIAPMCADSILINLEALSLGNFANLIIYDGTSSSGNVLYNSNTPSTGTVFTSTSGAAYVTFTSSYYLSSGFEISWESYIPSGNAGTASFTVDDLNPAFGSPINLTSTSTSDMYLWQWSFGDGNWSNMENPNHTYTTPGTFEIMLIASNCYAPDTTYTNVTVQDYPVINSVLDSIFQIVECNSIDSFLFTIENISGGELNYSLETELPVTIDSSVQYLTYNGENLTHSFSNIPTDIDTLKIEVRMNGDYSSSYEYIYLYIDNIYYATLYGGYDNIESTYNYILTGTTLQNYVSDGSIDIITDNSSSVNYYLSYENSNIVTIEYRNAASDFVSLNEDTNQVLVGQSDSVWFYIDMTNYTIGTYETTIFLNSNDSIGLYEIPLTIEVDGTAEVLMNSSCLDLGTVLIGDNTNASFTIENNGCADIQINSVTSSNSDLSWIGSATTLLASDTMTLNFGFNSISNGNILGDITIHTDAGSFTKCITGEVVLGPIASFTEGVLSESLDCNSPAVSQQTFTINNTGDQDLSVQTNGLSSSVNGVLVTPNNITVIAPSQSADFLLSITTGLINTSFISTDVLFTTNMTNAFNIPLIIQNSATAITPTFSHNIISIGQVSFVNTSVGNISNVSWSFGDGSSSTDPNPTHAYAANGSYTVILTVIDDCGGSYTESQTVLIQNVSIDEIENKGTIYPNPTTGLITINQPSSIEKVQVYSIAGKLLFTNYYEEETKLISINLGHLSNGNYLLHIHSPQGVSVSKVQVK